MFAAAGVTLPASDMERAKGFYRDKLGFEATEEREDGSVRYEVAGTTWTVYPSEFAGTNQATAAGLEVTDLDAAVAELRARGVVFEEYDYGEFSTVNGIMTLPDGSRGSWFKDPEGNIIGLLEQAA